MSIRLPDAPQDSQDEEFIELDQAIKRSLQRFQFKTGGHLQQMLERGKYGSHQTFRDYVVTDLRISEVTAFRLVFAHWVYELFKKRRLKRPLNERQVRPLTRLKKDEKSIMLAWTRACAQKQKSLPTYSDVTREVNRLVIPQKASGNDDGYRKYRAELEVMRAAEKRMSKLLEDGELETFRLMDDKKSIRQKRGFANGITKLGVRLGDHFRYWENYLEEPPEED
jgi:hypothetical protein